MTSDEIKNLRDRAFQWTKTNLVGKVVNHQDIEQPIELNNKGIKHTLKGKILPTPINYLKI